MHTWKKDIQIFLNSPDFHSWILAARPRTLLASLSPIIVGTALALLHGNISILGMLSCFLCALCFQVATNFINDASDFLQGTDIKERIGPPRAALEGLLSPRQLYIGSVAAFIIALIPGAYLIYLGGFPILFLGVLSIAAAIAYTAGPIPISYHALGDFFAFLFFGIIAVSGASYIQTLSFEPLMLVLGSITGLQATSIMAVNNTRDIETDRKSNKKTVSSLIGRKLSNHYYTALILFSYIITALYFSSTSRLLYFILFIPALYYAIKNISELYRAKTGKEFNEILKNTAFHQLLFSLALATSILL